MSKVNDWSSGYLDTREEACDMCGGSGELQLEDESC